MKSPKKTSVLVGLASAIAVLGPGVASAHGATSLCPEARICKPAKPDGIVVSKSSAAQPKIVPQRAKGARGQEAWQSGKWLME